MNMYTLMIKQIEQKKTKQESIELNEWIYLIQMEIKTAFSILFMLRVCAFFVAIHWISCEMWKTKQTNDWKFFTEYDGMSTNISPKYWPHWGNNIDKKW